MMAAAAFALLPALIAVAIFVATFHIRRDSARREVRLTMLPPERSGDADRSR